MADKHFAGEVPGMAVPCEHIIFTDLDGKEGVLVDLDTKKYYQLNETAALIWRGLERGLTMENVVKEIAAIYDVSDEHATLSVERIVREFGARKLIRPEPGAGRNMTA